MRIIYEACDGTIFDNEDDCLEYEGVLEHPTIIEIRFFDDEGKLYTVDGYNIYDDEVYYKCEKIELATEQELSDLHWLADECGWCEFHQIDSPGTWIRTQELKNLFEGKWVKE